MSPSPPPSRYNGPNLVLKYDRAQKRLVNIAVDKRSSPYYALRDRQGNAIGVTACDIDGDGREEIYFLNTNNAFSGKGLGPRASSCFPPSSSQHQLGQGLGDPGPPRHRSLLPPGPRSVPAGEPLLLLGMKLALISWLLGLEMEGLEQKPGPYLQALSSGLPVGAASSPPGPSFPLPPHCSGQAQPRSTSHPGGHNSNKWSP